jgi:pyruvate dehydrogenase E1 component beta subunit
MMIAAVEDDNPVIMIEHRWCHYVQGEVPSGYYKSDLTRPRRLREGKDATIVASSYMVLEAARAADALREIGVGIDLFDLRVLRPLTLDDVFASVRRTGRLMTVDTGFRILGIGGEIVAQTMEHAFGALKAKPMRLGMPDHPTPSSRGMVQGLYPDAAMIVRELGRCLALPENKIDAVVKGLEAARGDLPVDVPDPHFRGPF